MNPQWAKELVERVCRELAERKRSLGAAGLGIALGLGMQACSQNPSPTPLPPPTGEEDATGASASDGAQNTADSVSEPISIYAAPTDPVALYGVPDPAPSLDADVSDASDLTDAALSAPDPVAPNVSLYAAPDPQPPIRTDTDPGVDLYGVALPPSSARQAEQEAVDEALEAGEAVGLYGAPED